MRFKFEIICRENVLRVSTLTSAVVDDDAVNFTI